MSIWSAISALFHEKADPEHRDGSLEGNISTAADRFSNWVQKQTGEKPVPGEPDTYGCIDTALEMLIEKSVELNEAAAGDAAAFVGEAARSGHGGRWAEHEIYGLVLLELGGLADGKLIAAGLVEKKWAIKEKLSLATFLGTLGKRIEAEKTKQGSDVHAGELITDLLRDKSGDAANVAVQQLAQEFRLYWKQRYRVDLPFSLTGVRELDGFLRSHYFANFLPDRMVYGAGFYVGEVTRGLFEGKWVFDGIGQDAGIEKAALHFPELDYYPVGRILKMMTECPEGEALDEYIRLVPSARKELRG